MPADMVKFKSKLARATACAADGGTERDTEKERTVVPGQCGAALAGKIVRQTHLLCREKQLRDCRANTDDWFDESAGIESHTQYQQAGAEPGKTHPGGEFYPEAIGCVTADKNPGDRSAAIAQDRPRSMPGREANRDKSGAEVSVNPVQAGTPHRHRNESA